MGGDSKMKPDVGSHQDSTGEKVGKSKGFQGVWGTMICFISSGERRGKLFTDSSVQAIGRKPVL